MTPILLGLHASTMNRVFLCLLFFMVMSGISRAQQLESPCSHEAILERHLAQNSNAIEELNQQEKNMTALIEQIRANRAAGMSEVVIPVVMHVFHSGDDGMMGMEQALSGLQILNDDFNGLNDGWDTIDPEFDPVKASMDITFCLATIDPEGNPTTGINYYEDAQMMLNQGDLFQYAWDNYKYLNIYFPKYTSGEPSLFTAYAYYPSTFNTNNDIDGIFYSSIRWGFGDHSDLEEGQDWASVCSHEAGHWLNLRHTFEEGCNAPGDLVDDTPPTLGGTIELMGCDNNDFSCGVHTNGENFMDYNHDCKKMFTQGQVDRMTAALSLPSRINLWSFDNLVATGCEGSFTSIQESDRELGVMVFPVPAIEQVSFEFKESNTHLSIYNSQGQLLDSIRSTSNLIQLDLQDYSNGLYHYIAASGAKVTKGKFVKL